MTQVSTKVNIVEIGRDLTSFLERVRSGELFVIMDAGKPVAEIKPAAESAYSPRPHGLCAGEFQVPDSFFDPLPEEILRSFEV